MASVPEGQYDDARRAAIVAAVTGAVLDAKDGAHPRDPQRVWVFANETQRRADWGGGGRVMRLAHTLGHVIVADAAQAKRYADSRLAARGHQVAVRA